MFSACTAEGAGTRVCSVLKPLSEIVYNRQYEIEPGPVPANHKTSLVRIGSRSHTQTAPSPGEPFLFNRESKLQ